MRAERPAHEPGERVRDLDRLRAREREHDRIAGTLGKPLELVERLAPRHVVEAPGALDALHRRRHAVGCVERGIGEAAAVADPALVDLRVVAAEDAPHLALADRGARVAAGRAEAADRGDVLDLPRPRLEAVLGRGERADRAELDHVPGERRAVRLVLERGDQGLRAAVPRDQLAVLRDVLGEARAAVAEDAALAVERDRRRDRDRLVERPLVERHPRRAWPVAERQVLERALAALVADGAVERVVDEDELERRVLGLSGQLRRVRGLHGHPVCGRERARGLRLRRAGSDLAQAHAAGADRRPEPRLVAEDRDLDARQRSRFDEPGPLRHGDLDARRS